MTQSEQEALSNRYNIAAIVTPLSDGRFAVFANDRTQESLVIVEADALALAIGSRANRPGVSRKLPRQQTQQVVSQIINNGSSPEDYGL